MVALSRFARISTLVERCDDGGDLLRAKSFGDLQLEMGESVAALQNGILVVAGLTGNQETWLRKLTLEGLLRGESHLGGRRSAVVALTDSEFGTGAAPSARAVATHASTKAGEPEPRQRASGDAVAAPAGRGVAHTGQLAR
jgi:hypothetical protein